MMRKEPANRCGNALIRMQHGIKVGSRFGGDLRHYARRYPGYIGESDRAA